ncbi:MAG TPA: peptidoglycan DD-metalloendopeptidase family protein [Pyrinomonadaceae bacterium]
MLSVANAMSSMNPRTRILILAATVLALLAALIWYLSGRSPSQPATPVELPSQETPADAPAAPSSPTPSATPAESVSPSPGASPASSPSISASPEASGSPAPQSTPPQAINPQTGNAPPQASSVPAATGGAPQLSVPVAGVRPEQLQDTYTASRSEGRTHNAIDIIAPRGTPVVAAADGKIVKLFQSVPGGITIYQLSTDEKMVYYYAHLDRYADGLQEGHFARRGETIGYVGDTGNAGSGNYHLHFSVSLISDPKRHWDGVNINPYPLFKK